MRLLPCGDRFEHLHPRSYPYGDKLVLCGDRLCSFACIDAGKDARRDVGARLRRYVFEPCFQSLGRNGLVHLSRRAPIYA